MPDMGSPKLGLAVLVLALAALASGAQAAEETVDAFAPWEGVGKLYQTGETEAVFVGALEGRLFVQAEAGPREVGRLTCPVAIEVELDTARQTGEGRCVIVADDGAKLFGTLTCEGVHFLGCDGEFRLTGGTQRFAGISGRGPVSVRTTSRGLVRPLRTGDPATELGRGTLVLTGFSYTVPSHD